MRAETATWTRYRDNVARHLIGIARDLESRVVRSLGEDAGFGGLRPSFGPILSLLWGEGLPLSVVASELAISKQACGQLANTVAAAGYLERVPNPADRRSKKLVLTARGRSLVEQGARLILAIDAEYRSLLSATAYRQFTWALGDLYRSRGLPMNTDPDLEKVANESVGTLPLIAVRVQRELMEATGRRGHPGLKMSHGQVLPLLGADGGRIVEIARLQGVSRQSISTISQDLEHLGYLSREADPVDGRGVVLRLTAAGQALIEDSVAALDELESSFEEALGARGLRLLKRTARELYRALRLEAEIFGAPRDAAAGADARRSPRREGRLRTAPSRGRDNEEIQRLASRLRSELGHGDAARLAALLS